MVWTNSTKHATAAVNGCQATAAIAPDEGGAQKIGGVAPIPRAQ